MTSSTVFDEPSLLELASRNAYQAAYIKYAEAYNSKAVFVKDPKTGQFLIRRDFEDNPAPEPLSSQAGSATE